MIREKKTEYVMREKEIMGILVRNDHPFFVKLFATFQDRTRLCILSIMSSGESS